MIKLGYAETDITPNIPLQLVGFNITRLFWKIFLECL